MHTALSRTLSTKYHTNPGSCETCCSLLEPLDPSQDCVFTNLSIITAVQQTWWAFIIVTNHSTSSRIFSVQITKWCFSYFVKISFAVDLEYWVVSQYHLIVNRIKYIWPIISTSLHCTIRSKFYFLFNIETRARTALCSKILALGFRWTWALSRPPRFNKLHV